MSWSEYLNFSRHPIIFRRIVTPYSMRGNTITTSSCLCNNLCTYYFHFLFFVVVDGSACWCTSSSNSSSNSGSPMISSTFTCSFFSHRCLYDWFDFFPRLVRLCSFLIFTIFSMMLLDPVVVYWGSTLPTLHSSASALVIRLVLG